MLGWEPAKHCQDILSLPFSLKGCKEERILHRSIRTRSKDTDLGLHDPLVMMAHAWDTGRARAGSSPWEPWIGSVDLLITVDYPDFWRLSDPPGRLSVLSLTIGFRYHAILRVWWLREDSRLRHHRQLLAAESVKPIMLIQIREINLIANIIYRSNHKDNSPFDCPGNPNLIPGYHESDRIGWIRNNRMNQHLWLDCSLVIRSSLDVWNSPCDSERDFDTDAGVRAVLTPPRVSDVLLFTFPPTLHKVRRRTYSPKNEIISLRKLLSVM